MPKRTKVPIPESPDGKLGYIAGAVDSMQDTIDGISDSLGQVKSTMVTKNECRDHRSSIVGSIKSGQPAEVTGQVEKPKNFDIWAWAAKRFQVILMLAAILSGIGVFYKLYLDTKEVVAKSENRPPPQTKVVSIPIHHYHFISPDSGVKKEKPKRRHRKKKAP